MWLQDAAGHAVSGNQSITPWNFEVGTITFEGETDCSNLDFQDGHVIFHAWSINGETVA